MFLNRPVSRICSQCVVCVTHDSLIIFIVVCGSAYVMRGVCHLGSIMSLPSLCKGELFNDMVEWYVRPLIEGVVLALSFHVLVPAIAPCFHDIMAKCWWPLHCAGRTSCGRMLDKHT